MARARSEHWLAVQPWGGPDATATAGATSASVSASEPPGLARRSVPGDLTPLAWHALRFTPRVAWVGADEALASARASIQPSTPPAASARARTWAGAPAAPAHAAAPTLVLEVSASERLFGGRAALLQRFFEEIPPYPSVKWSQGATVWIAVGRLALPPNGGPTTDMAPKDMPRRPSECTPRRPPEKGERPSPAQGAGRSPECGAATPPEALPLSALAAAQPHLGTLARLGCRTWGELRALPRDGVARRFGAGLLDVLDQAFGRRPVVLPWVRLPEAFDEALELPFHVESAPALLVHAHVLLARLQAWLRARAAGVLALELRWQHDRRREGPATGALPLRTAEPWADLRHIERLLAEHLARLRWHAPVHGLRLRVLQTAPLPGASDSLLPLAAGERAEATGWSTLIERLGARLGPGAVLQVQRLDDPRPEAMQRWVPAGASKKEASHDRFVLGYAGKTDKNGATPTRWRPPDALLPPWLLAQPLPLALRGERPQYQGALRLRVGPQRIEALVWTAGAEGREADAQRSAARGGAHHALTPAGHAEGGVAGDAAGHAAGHAAADTDTATDSPAHPGPAAWAGRAAASAASAASAAEPARGGAAAVVVQRDYFIAESPRAGLVWVFRQRRGAGRSAAADERGPQADAPAWFLHGFFG